MTEDLMLKALLFALVSIPTVILPVIYLVQAITWPKFVPVKAEVVRYRFSGNKVGGRRKIIARVKYVYEGIEYTARIRHPINQRVDEFMTLNCMVNPRNPKCIIMDGYQKLPIRNLIAILVCVGITVSMFISKLKNIG